VLVDDTFTTGNTLTGLFDYVSGLGPMPEGIFAIASGRYSKAIAATPEKIRPALDKAGVSAEEFQRATGLPIERFTGAELHAYTLNGGRGLAGFRRRFGLEPGTASPPVGTGENSGRTAGQVDPTFSIARRGDPLLAAINSRITSPEKKADVYKRMKARVADVKRRFDDRRLKGEFDTAAGTIDRSRFEQIRDLATLEAIGKAMPPEIRGKIIGSFRQLADLRTTKGRTDYMGCMTKKS
jgi:hypothetical protein